MQRGLVEEIAAEAEAALLQAEQQLIEAEEVHEFGALNTLLCMIVLALSFLLAYLIKKHRIIYLPESAAIILLGILVGLLASLFHPSKAELELLTFQPEVFYFGLLPPIIFNAGYTCRRKHFFQNIVAITLYAVVGTFISTFFIGYCTYTMGNWGWIDMDTSSPVEPLLFGAMISAVNPVATLSVMDIIMGAESPGEKCDPLLYSLVFGESVLNDAVAIGLFHTFNKFHDTTSDGGLILEAMASFIVTSFGSVATGTGIGLACSYFCKHTSIRDHPHLELAILFLFSYGAYAFAESVELSGIMALFFCGIVLAHYNSYNLSEASRRTAELSAKMLAQVSEHLVFVYMGMGFFTGRFTRWDPTLIAAAIVLCLVARVFNTFPLSALANLTRPEPTKISPKMQVVIWFSGLRGAIAFALSQTMPGPNRDLYVTTTLSVVIFTTVFCGGLTEPLLSLTGMKSSTAEQGDEDGSSEDEGEPLVADYRTAQSGTAQSGTAQSVAGAGHLKRQQKDGLLGRWRDFEERYIKPTFGGSERTAPSLDRQGAGKGDASTKSGAKSGGGGRRRSRTPPHALEKAWEKAQQSIAQARAPVVDL